jgi:hypothetical protein
MCITTTFGELGISLRRENRQITRSRNFNNFSTRRVQTNNIQILCRPRPVLNLRRLNTLFKCSKITSHPKTTLQPDAHTSGWRGISASSGISVALAVGTSVAGTSALVSLPVALAEEATHRDVSVCTSRPIMSTSLSAPSPSGSSSASGYEKQTN